MPIVTPVIQPPRLDDCCHLSEQAQIVWRSMVDKHNREKQILEERKRHFSTYSMDYYKSLYEAKFKSELPSFSTQKSQRDQSASHFTQKKCSNLLRPEFTHSNFWLDQPAGKGIDDIVIKTEAPSPVKPKEATPHESFAPIPRFQDLSSLLLENNIYPSPIDSKAVDDQSHQKEVNDFVPSQDLFASPCELSPPLDLSPACNDTNNKDERPLFTISTDFLSQNIRTASHNSDEKNIGSAQSSIDHGVGKVSKVSCTVPGNLNESELNNVGPEFMACQARTGFDNERLDTDQPVVNKFISDGEFQNAESRLPVIQSDNAQNESSIAQKRTLSGDGDDNLNPRQGACSVTSTNSEKRSCCSINDRLKEHQKFRKRVKDSGETKIDMPKKSSSLKPIQKFFAPFKKPKLSEEFDSPSKKQESHRKSDAGAEITLEEKVERIQSIDKFCEAILITLVYSDGTTMLSTDSSSVTKGKSMKSTPKVQVCGFVIAAGHIQKHEDIVKINVNELRAEEKEIVRNVISALIVSNTEKICFDAKEFFKFIIDQLNVKVSMNCTIIDPVIAVWLSNPDKPVTSFSDMTESLKISRKVLHGDNNFEEMKEDLYVLKLCMDILKKRLQQQDLLTLFYKIEMNLVPVLARMELRDICVETKTFLDISHILKKKLSKLEKEAHNSIGHSFQINSHVQLRQVIFEELKLDQKLTKKTKIAKTSSGHLKSTSEAVLAQFRDIHPLPSIVLEYRQLQKLKSTYINGMLSCITDGKLRTKWDQASAATGRLASCHPNIQAIPKTAFIVTGYKENYIAGKEIEDRVEIYAREPFVSQNGWTLLAADFQQIELRLLAHLSNDDVLLKLFSNTDSQDVFIQLTSDWLGKSFSEVTSFEREQTKRIVYSVMYGAGKEKLSEYLKISADEAKAIMNSFLSYTTTIFNRRRMFPNINHHSPVIRAQAERQAVNFCVQGSAADICKTAMIELEKALQDFMQPLNTRLLVQIHDELLLEVPDEELDVVKGIVKTVMESSDVLCGDFTKLKVPLKVSLSVGKSWAHMTQCLLEE